MKLSKPNQTRWRMSPQPFHTIPTSCAILLFLHKYTFFVSCVQRRVMEVSAVSSAACVVHIDMSYRTHGLISTCAYLQNCKEIYA